MITIPAVFFFLFGRAPLRGAGLSAAIRSLPRLHRGKAARFALRLLSVGSSFPLQSLAPSAPLFNAVFCAFSCNFRSRPAAVFAGLSPSRRRFDSGRISGLLRVCRLQRSILCLFLQPLFPFGTAANACFSVTDGRFLTDKRLISQ